MTINTITSWEFNNLPFPSSSTQIYQVVDMAYPNLFTYQNGWMPSSGSRLADAPASTTTPALVDTSSGALSKITGLANHNVGLRHFYGRYSTVANPVVGDTYHDCFELPVGCDAIKLILANIVTAGTCMIQAAVVSSPDASDPAYLAAPAGDILYPNWSAGYKAGSLSVASIAVTTNAGRPVYEVSDIISLQTKPRADGTPGAVVHVRSYTRPNTDTTGSYTVLGNGSTDTWIDQGVGQKGYRHWCFKQAGAQTLSPWNSFVGTPSRVSPIAGIIYYARGRVINGARFGDSISDGRGTLVGDGYLRPACIAMNGISNGAVWECSNYGWSGAPSSQFLPIAKDVLSTFPVDIAFIHHGSPNDVNTTPGTMVQANCGASWTFLPDVLSTARAAGTFVIPVTWAPSNNSTATPAGVHNYGATDSFRVAYNANLMASNSACHPVLDLSTVMSGPVDGTGQTMLAPSLTIDGTHPNDAGNALLTQSAVAILQRFAL